MANVAEACTVRVRMNESCYVSVRVPARDAMTGKEVFENQIFSGHREQVQLPDGKQSSVWKGDEFWTTPAQANKWLTDNIGRQLDRPIVAIVGNRSADDAKLETVPPVQQLPVARPTAAVS